MPEFNQKGEAYGLTKFDDDPQQKNYYRLTLTRNRRADTLSLNAFLDDPAGRGGKFAHLVPNVLTPCSGPSSTSSGVNNDGGGDSPAVYLAYS